MTKRLTTEEINKRIEELTNGEYLLLEEYVNAHTKMLIRHNVCKNEYRGNWNNFKSGRRCPKCFSNERLSSKEIDKRIKELVNDEYIRLSEYLGAETKMLIKHSICQNEYKVTWSHFKRGIRCPRCSGNEKLNNQEIDKRIEELTKGEYIRLSEYKGTHTKMLVKHNLCRNEYRVTWGSFQQGNRCPKCNESKGEKEISNVLNSLGIKYTPQKRFKECKYKSTLPFDFYIHNKKSKLLIEFDGEQHFKTVEHFGGEKNFQIIQIRDQIKNNFALSKNIPLLRISYTEQDNIKQILTDKLKELHFI